jgi:hypothetical protein
VDEFFIACGKHGEYMGRHHTHPLVKQTLPLIERLCQPNIVIVDLDDEKVQGRVFDALKELYGDNADRIEIWMPDIKKLLAALKEK